VEGKPKISKPEGRNREIPPVIPIKGINNCLVLSAVSLSHRCTINFKLPDKANPEVKAVRKPITSKIYGGSRG